MQFSWDATHWPSLCCSPPPPPPPQPPFPLTICYATLALQLSSHWSPSLSPPVLICYAGAIPSCTSRWSLSTELSITFSLSPSLPLPLPPSPCCLIFYFCCQRFVSPYSTLLRCFSSATLLSADNREVVQHLETACEDSSFSLVHICAHGGISICH